MSGKECDHDYKQDPSTTEWVCTKCEEVSRPPKSLRVAGFNLNRALRALAEKKKR